MHKPNASAADARRLSIDIGVVLVEDIEDVSQIQGKYQKFTAFFMAV